MRRKLTELARQGWVVSAEANRWRLAWGDRFGSCAAKHAFSEVEARTARRMLRFLGEWTQENETSVASMASRLQS